MIEGVKAYLLDLDGTVYLGDRLIGNVKSTLARLREQGNTLVFVTNNSSRTEEEYRTLLKKRGLFHEGDLIYTSGMATADYLSEHFRGAHVHLLGTDALKEEWRAAGILLDEKTSDVCVLAYDVTLTFAKMKAFNEALVRGNVYLATHPDDVCPTAGIPMPDAGSFLALFERSSGRTPSVIIGKPNPYMGIYLGRRLGMRMDELCMVGDRMYTDIRFANTCGMKSVLVLSGETTKETMKAFPDQPTLVLDTINDIL